jgi:RNase_H superfamily
MLRRRYPDVCSAEQVEALSWSARVIDLYSDVVAPHREWPLQSYGLKAIAKSCGFRWRVADAGGASSIAWFDEWRRTGDRTVLERIIDYNRSDVIASAVVLDALRDLRVRPTGPLRSPNLCFEWRRRLCRSGSAVRGPGPRGHAAFAKTWFIVVMSSTVGRLPIVENTGMWPGSRTARAVTASRAMS